MKKFLNRIPHILVLQETSVQPGQDKLRGIFNYAHLYGPWNLHLLNGRVGELRPTSFTDWTSYDGIIAGQMMIEVAEHLKKTRLPVVLMDPLDEALAPDSPLAHFSYTIDDSDGIGRAASAYFISRGYTHYAYCSDPLNRNWSIRRGKSFCDWVRKAGFSCHLYGGTEKTDNRITEENRLSDWLAALPKPVALLAAMDTCAHYVIELCIERGLRIPQDVAVLGIDDDELLCNGSSPTLSSIRRDTEDCGFMAAQMLDRLMRKETRKRNVMRYGVKEIVTRDSTQLHAVPDDPFARRAREFIRINAGTNICVSDIVRHLGGSRRFVETRFRAECGRSLHDEIQNARLERVETLLKETNLKLSDICVRCGYQTDVNLRYFFKQRFGCSMRDYRKRHKEE